MEADVSFRFKRSVCSSRWSFFELFHTTYLMKGTFRVKKRYDALDCLKGLACLAVVLIHYNFSGGDIPGYISVSLKAACRFAVPVFFTISGFFLAKGREIDSENVLRKLRHVLKLIFFSGVFYLFFSMVWYRLYEGADWDQLSFTLELLTGDKLLKLLLTNDPLLYSHLWFLFALFNCYAFVLLFLQQKTYKLVYLLAPVSLCAYACMQEFRLLPTSVQLTGMDTRIYFFNSFLFRALPFFLIGMILRDQLTLIQSKPVRKSLLWVLAAFGICLEVGERFIFGESQFYVGSYLTAYSLILFALQYPEDKVSILQHIGRDLSMWIYILHIAVGKSLDVVAKYSHMWGHNWYYISRPLIIIGVSLLVAEALHQIGKTLSRLRSKSASIVS